MSNYGRKTSAEVKEIDEVEELLRATEDDMLLKLSVGSHHVSRSSSSSLDQDLIRRFEALKKPSVSNTITNVPSNQSKEKKKEGKNDEKDGGDVFARFSALKSGSCSSSSDLMMVSSSSEMSKVRSDGGCDGSTNSSHEDEVSKVIQWAIDAARLDPSLSDDDEDELEEESNNEDDDDVSENESDSDSDDVKRKPCNSGSKKKKPSKS